MPESTPLVFPALDNVAQSVVQSGDVEKKNAFMKMYETCLHLLR